MGKPILGIDLGGTGIKASLIRAATGEVITRMTRPTCDGEVVNGHPVWAVNIRDIVEEVESDHGAPDSIGISCPGLVAADELSIACMPDRLDGLVGFNWTSFLEREDPVYVINDAHSALLAEVHFGAAKGMRNVYMIVIGTGVGGAIYADGKILKGHIGRAGHLGHICLDIDGEPDITGIPGSIEDMIGNHNIAERSKGAFATTHEMISAYADGDETAVKIWLRSVRALACSIASLNNVLDPGAVIIGGGIGKAGQHLLDPLGKELDQIEWRPLGKRVPLVQAKLDEWAGSIGAAVHSHRKNHSE
jgi:glucokinase